MSSGIVEIPFTPSLMPIYSDRWISSIVAFMRATAGMQYRRERFRVGYQVMIKARRLCFFLGVLVVDSFAAFAAPALTEQILPNLSSGPPADPLPALRPNQPSAARMAAQPRTHPYLFFDTVSRPAFRERARAEPFRGMAERMRIRAEECLKREIPPLARVFDEIPSHLPDGSYNPEYLRRNYDDFYDQAYIVKEVIPTLGFAYQLTGDRRFGDAGKKWLLNYAGRDKLARKSRAADFDAANMAYGMALGYDWLWELLSDPERHQVQRALGRLALPIVAAGEALLQDPLPQRKRGSMGNNHQTRTHGLFALTPLVLLYEIPEAAGWLDTEIQLHRDRLYPSAWAPNGEHLDAWDHFESSLEDPLLFVAALQHMGGENFFHDATLAPRFRGISHFYLYGLEHRFSEASNRLTSPPAGGAWLALARHVRDPVAQWLGTRDDGLKKIHPMFAYLFYDPAIKAAPPADPAGSVYFPHAGMVKMCSDWSPEGIFIPFRCGPEIGKDVGDQNGFRLRAGGEWMFPRLPSPSPAAATPYEFRWELYAWFGGSPAQNIILPEPEGVADSSALAQGGRLLPFTGALNYKGGIQFAVYPPMKGRTHGKQWLSGPEIPKNGDLRVVHFSPVLDYVCGEAHRAYAYFPPRLWVRHLLFVKGQPGGAQPYILVCDEIEAEGEPRDFAWQLHTPHPFSVADHSMTVHGRRAGMTVHFLAPRDRPIIAKETPAPLPEQRTQFIQWRTAAPQSRCFYLTALLPPAPGNGAPAPSFRVIDAAGGWAVVVTAGTFTDTVMFRSERANSVSAQGVTTTGAAALLRRSGENSALLYSLGKQPSRTPF